MTDAIREVLAEMRELASDPRAVTEPVEQPQRAAA